MSMSLLKNFAAGERKLELGEGFHSWAVAVVTERKGHWSRAMLAALISFVVIGTQVMTVLVVMTDSGEPVCVSSSDCRNGETCWPVGDGMSDLGQCVDCSYVQEPNNTDYVCPSGTTIDVSAWDDDDETKKCLNCPLPLNSGVHQQGAQLKCLAIRHCTETDVMPGKCDHLELALAKLTPPRHFVLWMMTLLLAQPLATDMDESSAEESLLAFAGVHFAPVFSFRGLLHRFAGLLVLVGLRIRRVVMPFLIAGLAAVALIGDAGFSALNILLNLLAVAFITEMDNIFAAILLPEAAKHMAESILDEANEAGFIKHKGWFGHRVLSLLCSFLVVVIIWDFKYKSDATYDSTQLSSTKYSPDDPTFCNQIDSTSKATVFFWSFWYIFAKSAFFLALDIQSNMTGWVMATTKPGASVPLPQALACAIYNISLNLTAWLACGWANLAVNGLYDIVPSAFFCESSDDGCFSRKRMNFLDTSGVLVFGLCGFVLTFILFSALPTQWLHFAAKGDVKEVSAGVSKSAKVTAE